MSLSNVYLLQLKPLGSLVKTKVSLRSPTPPPPLSLSPLVSFPNFSQRSENPTLSLMGSRNSTKFALDLFATSSIGEPVLDHQITM